MMAPEVAQGEARLDEVLRRARLTPNQAIVMASDLLNCVRTIDAASDPRGQVVAGEGSSMNIGALAATLEGIAKATLPFPSSGNATLGAALEALALEAHDTTVEELARRLPGPSPDEARARRELGSLAALVADHDVGGVRRTAEERIGMALEPYVHPAVAARSPFAPGERKSGAKKSRRRLLARSGAAAMVLFAAFAGGYQALHRRVAADLHRLVASSPTSSASNAPAPLAALGPTSAGFISGVEVRPLSACTNNQGCQLALVLDLRPQARPQTLSWHFVVVERCGGRSVVEGGGSASVPAGAPSLVVLGKTRLPATTWLSLSAVVQPYGVSSTPVALRTGSGTCRTHAARTFGA